MVADSTTFLKFTLCKKLTSNKLNVERFDQIKGGSSVYSMVTTFFKSIIFKF